MCGGRRAGSQALRGSVPWVRGADPRQPLARRPVRRALFRLAADEFGRSRSRMDDLQLSAALRLELDGLFPLLAFTFAAQRQSPDRARLCGLHDRAAAFVFEVLPRCGADVAIGRICTILRGWSPRSLEGALGIVRNCGKRRQEESCEQEGLDFQHSRAPFQARCISRAQDPGFHIDGESHCQGSLDASPGIRGCIADRSWPCDPNPTRSGASSSTIRPRSSPSAGSRSSIGMSGNEDWRWRRTRERCRLIPAGSLLSERSTIYLDDRLSTAAGPHCSSSANGGGSGRLRRRAPSRRRLCLCSMGQGTLPRSNQKLPSRTGCI